jgi:hypothetical protein
MWLILGFNRDQGHSTFGVLAVLPLLYESQNQES